MTTEREDERRRNNAEVLDYLTGDGEWQLGMSAEEAAEHLIVICPQASDALEQALPVECGHHNCELYAKAIYEHEDIQTPRKAVSVFLSPVQAWAIFGQPSVDAPDSGNAPEE